MVVVIIVGFISLSGILAGVWEWLALKYFVLDTGA